MQFISPQKLRKLGILGMNRRNVEFINRYNSRKYYPLVDDKLKTKLLAERYGLATPHLLGVVRYQHEVGKIAKLLPSTGGFVIKPSKGSGGRGILVITAREGDTFIKSSGARLSVIDIKRHLSNTLAGLYSLAGAPDVAIVEDLIGFDDRFLDYSYEGVPDIRVIVFQGYPVLAMLRLATRASDGKANLHQGAVGVGIDIATGECLQAVQHARRIARHPDTGKELSGLRIGDWSELLVLASRCYEMTRLGYLGVDLVLDKGRGPLLLELNARPGLSIQVANGVGLEPRLRKIEGLDMPYATPADRARFAMGAFRVLPNVEGDTIASPSKV